ncbi:MAG: energy transducer TonB [Paraglaciecola sp.]|nr:energy transducer TonB [Paraglaciecola sp.]NCT49818.1 energy transducer TonB [Paraglaciecola sp.]
MTQSQTLLPPALPLGKLTMSALLAALITFALFVLMQALIASNDVPLITSQASPQITLLADFKEIPTTERQPLKPKPTPQPIPKVSVPLQQTPNDDSVITRYVPEVRVNAGEIAIEPQFQNGGMATPAVRMEPRYPAEAARNGVEGWVKLQFSIDALGQVQHIQVVDAQPKRVFDSEARRALAKWKYKPQIVAGKAQAQDGMMVVLDFKLNQ